MAIDRQHAGKWNIDAAHSRIGFSTRHAMVARIRGAFNEVSGEVYLDSEHFDQSTVRVVINAASIDTRQGDRDNHLRSPDFLNVEEFPEITFISSTVDEISDDNFIVTGDLTIRGITRAVSIPLELLGMEADPSGALRAGLEGTRRIDRRDWGVTWNTPLDSGGVLVSDKITLEFELALVKE